MSANENKKPQKSTGFSGEKLMYIWNGDWFYVEWSRETEREREPSVYGAYSLRCDIVDIGFSQQVHGFKMISHSI